MTLPGSIKLLNLPTYEAGLLQARAYRALSALFREWLAQLNLTMNEWALIGRLYQLKTDGMTHSEISKMLSVRPPFATNIVNGLEKKGLVQREVSPDDARTKRVYLTAAGKKLVPKTERELRSKMKETLRGIKLSDVANYMAVLQHLARSAE